MRHNRRAVMAEQYKLYMKRNILNGKYFVRNIQILMCVITTVLVICGVIFLINNKNDSGKASGNQISVKDALFGSNDVTEAEITATTEVKEESVSTEEAVTEAVEEETITAMSEITAVVDNNAVSNDNGSVKDAVIENAASTVTETLAAAEEESEQEDQGEFANRCIANVDETLNIRKEPSRDADFVGMMSQGAIATVVDTESEWTKIKSGDVEGYVLSEYVLTGESAEEFAKDYVTVQGTAIEDGVNVREDRSTDANILKVLDKDDIVSVLEVPENEVSENNDKEAEVKENDETEDENESEPVDKADDITWVTVMLEDGQIGYVSKDYIDVDKLYTLAVSAEELQRREEERLAAEKAAAEAAILAAQQTASSAPASSSTDNSSTYHGATTTPITAASSGECLGTFTLTAYCGCSKCCGGNKTATGTTPTQGRTIAADTSVLPYGTQVVINGIVYTVEDCGGGVKGNHIDIFFATHEDAIAFGRQSAKVYKY